MQKIFDEIMNINFLIKNADVVWHKLRWRDGIKCPKCGCEEYWELGDGRYKCKGCGKIFSDTTDTLLHHSHLDKWQWLWAIYKMSNSKGISTIELSRDLAVNYTTAHIMQQKIRYAMDEDRSFSGIVRMDEAYIGGWSGMHFKKKMEYLDSNDFLNEEGKYTKSTLLAAVSKKKHHIVSIVDESGYTKIIHTPNPITKDIIRQILERYDSGIETLVTDESKLYKGLKWNVEQSCHSKAVFITKTGLSSNVCENRFSWIKRKWNGIYTHTSEKYLQLYLNQMAFTVNNKDKTVQEKFETLCGLCAKAHVTRKEITEYNYLDKFNFDNKYNKEKEEALQVLDIMGGLAKSVETKHKMVFKKK